MMKIFIIIDIIMSIMILFFFSSLLYIYLVPVRYIVFHEKFTSAIDVDLRKCFLIIFGGHSRKKFDKRRISTDKLTIGKIIISAKVYFFPFIHRTFDFGHNNIHSEYGSS